MRCPLAYPRTHSTGRAPSQWKSGASISWQRQRHPNSRSSDDPIGCEAQWYTIGACWGRQARDHVHVLDQFYDTEHKSYAQFQHLQGVGGRCTLQKARYMLSLHCTGADNLNQHKWAGSKNSCCGCMSYPISPAMKDFEFENEHLFDDCIARLLPMGLRAFFVLSLRVVEGPMQRLSWSSTSRPLQAQPFQLLWCYWASRIPRAAPPSSYLLLCRSVLWVK